MKFVRGIYGSLLVFLAAPLAALAQPGQNLAPQQNPWLQNLQNTYSNPLGGGYSPGNSPGENFYDFGGGVGYNTGRPLTSPSSGGRGISTVSGSNDGFTGIMRAVNVLINYFQVIIFVTALVYLLRGAFLFTQGKEKDAAPMILNAVIGIVVALLAFAVIPFICSVTGAGGEACFIGTGR